MVLHVFNGSGSGARAAEIFVPAITTAACTGHVDILKRLVLHPLTERASEKLVEQVPRIVACGRLSCCEIVFRHVIPVGSVVSHWRDKPAGALLDNITARDMQ